jgi:hypothetical protein
MIFPEVNLRWVEAAARKNEVRLLELKRRSSDDRRSSAITVGPGQYPATSIMA